MKNCGIKIILQENSKELENIVFLSTDLSDLEKKKMY